MINVRKFAKMIEFTRLMSYIMPQKLDQLVFVLTDISIDHLRKVRGSLHSLSLLEFLVVQLFWC